MESWGITDDDDSVEEKVGSGERSCQHSKEKGYSVIFTSPRNSCDGSRPASEGTKSPYLAPGEKPEPPLAQDEEKGKHSI